VGNSTRASDAWGSFEARHELLDWESWFHPGEPGVHAQVVARLQPEDVVLDLGAGDLRLAQQMAGSVLRVYAVEVNPLLVGEALARIGLDLPRNVHVVCSNALDFPVPPGVTVGTLLMRHCQHFAAFFERLRASGCRRLLTNARWKSGVEEIDLQAHRVAFSEVTEGWYACRCGAVGYVGQGEQPLSVAVEVAGCPVCASSWES
jgi:hypothetical protein